MSMREELLKEFSKSHTVHLAKKIGADQAAFDEMVELMLHDEIKVTQRAAWVVSHCFDDYPWLIEKHLETLIDNLANTSTDTVKRNTVRILQFVDIPDDLLGITADTCFSLLNSSKESIAVRAHCMTILFNVVKKYPEMKEELKVSIEDQLPFASAGIKNRGLKILKAIEKL